MNDETPEPFDIVGDQPVEARIVAWVLGEASAFEAAELERLCEERPELLVFRRRMRALHGLLTEAEASEEDHSWKLPPEKRAKLDEIFGAENTVRLEIARERGIRRSGRRAILGIAACVGLAVVVMRLIPRGYESHDTIEIRPRTSGMSFGSDASGKAPASAMTPQFFGTEFEKIKSRNNLEKVVDNLDLTDRWKVDKETAIKRLKGSVNPKNIRGTDLVEIQVRQPNEKDAKDIAREVATSYRDYRNEIEQRDSAKALAELNKAVRDPEDKVEERRKTLASIVRTKGVIYKGQDSFYGQSGVDEDTGTRDRLNKVEVMKDSKRQEAITRGLDAQDDADAKRDFETDQKLLQTMRLEQIKKTIEGKMPDESIMVHDMPDSPSNPLASVAKSAPVAPPAAPKPSASLLPPVPMSLAKSKENRQEIAKRERLVAGKTTEKPVFEARNTAGELADASPVEAMSGNSSWSGAAGGGGLGGGALKSDLNGDTSGFKSETSVAIVDGIPPVTSSDEMMINGLRSGDQAVSRHSIDAILNNPNRVAGERVLGGQLGEAAEGEKRPMPTLADKDGDSRFRSSGDETVVELDPAAGSPQPKEFEGFVNYGSPIQSSDKSIAGKPSSATAISGDPFAEKDMKFRAGRSQSSVTAGVLSILPEEDAAARSTRPRVVPENGEAKFARDALDGPWKSEAPVDGQKQLAADSGQAAQSAGSDRADNFQSLEEIKPPTLKAADVKEVEARYRWGLADESTKAQLQDHESSNRPESEEAPKLGDIPVIGKLLENSESQVAPQAGQKLNLGLAGLAQFEMVRRQAPVADSDAAPSGVGNQDFDLGRLASDATSNDTPFANDMDKKLRFGMDLTAGAALRFSDQSDEIDSYADPASSPESMFSGKNTDLFWDTSKLAESGKDSGGVEYEIHAGYSSEYLFRGVNLEEKNLESAVVPLADLMEEIAASKNPYSTFSLNISDASFQLAKAALAKGERPEPESIKVEQFYNAVDYGDPTPSSDQPVAAMVEQSAHPVIPGRNLVRVALRTASVGRSASQPLRLTLLVDQSGSMVREDRRTAMEHALTQLAGLLTKDDSVTVIGFSRTPHLLADGLTGDQGEKLSGIINQTASEGGTNLEQAILLGAQKSREHQLAGAQNRIVLFTDGAANLGNANPERLAKQVTELRQQGIAFDIAGIGADGLNDRLLGELSRHGNGRYYVVGDAKNDSFARQLAGAFRPAAENVKVQVNFNPQRVGRYKLIGFEKDRLKTEDFRNDAVDAAELATDEAGVALYQVEPLADGTGEIGEVSVRFRDVASGEMVERTWTIPNESTATAFDRATPSMQLAGLSMLAAEKLKGGPMADAIDFKQFAAPIGDVKQVYGASQGVADMLQVIDKLR
jgi:Mg-chelatase subunit ChlD/capsular polysaccharide biosynthesis protein